ncbi:MAG: hypothetical protein AVDCRST_MAG58-3687, partial [uncultured Rubrobacteraceae bacterium]
WARRADAGGGAPSRSTTRADRGCCAGGQGKSAARRSAHQCCPAPWWRC